MQIKLTYFDIRARAEAQRLALHLGGVLFEDERLNREQFVALKASGTLPLGQVPILTVDGKVLTQSKAQLRFCGRLANLYPTDAWAAAKVDEVIDILDDIMAPMSATMRLSDDEEKKTTRKEILDTKWPSMLAAVDKMLADNGTGYFVGDSVTIADLQVYVLFSWVSSGVIDHVPTTVFAAYPHIAAHQALIPSLPKVAEWNAAHQKK